MARSIVARISALKSMSTPELKEMWNDLFDAAPPAYNRRFLESRLAYRIQEIEYGGLKPDTLERLAALGDRLNASGKISVRRGNHDRPITGTKLIRQYKGVEHCVTVLDDGYEYQGRPYKSLSSVARAITGTAWNGWLFFGLRNHKKT
jgi:hypothetical protein